MTIKIYLIKLTTGLVAYLVGLVTMNVLVKLDPNLWFLFALLPIVPLVYVAFTFLGFILTMDEMLRKIQMESLAFAAIATGFTCFSCLFLVDSGSIGFSPDWAFYMMWGYYGIGVIWNYRRYR